MLKKCYFVMTLFLCAQLLFSNDDFIESVDGTAGGTTTEPTDNAPATEQAPTVPKTEIHANMIFGSGLFVLGGDIDAGALYQVKGSSYSQNPFDASLSLSLSDSSFFGLELELAYSDQLLYSAYGYATDLGLVTLGSAKVWIKPLPFVIVSAGKFTNSNYASPRYGSPNNTQFSLDILTPFGLVLGVNLPVAQTGTDYHLLVQNLGFGARFSVPSILDLSAEFLMGGTGTIPEQPGIFVGSISLKAIEKLDFVVETELVATESQHRIYGFAATSHLHQNLGYDFGLISLSLFSEQNLSFDIISAGITTNLRLIQNLINPELSFNIKLADRTTLEAGKFSVSLTNDIVFFDSTLSLGGEFGNSGLGLGKIGQWGWELYCVLRVSLFN